MSTANIVPPFRAPLISDQGSENGAGQATTTRAWYLFFENLSSSVGILHGMVNRGTHQDRLATSPADIPEGALWIESDPPGGGVLYQVRDGRWYYVAGTKWGTLSPDQRPADLTADDAGYEWRSTDQPPRDFLWSGTAWVEITPVRYGTHASRVATATASIWQGVLWVETDRGNVIYENQGGAWTYVAGVMNGTQSPDQRPTDLAANDTGFLFQATDTLHLFRWSGTAWADQTPAPANDAQYAKATAALSLTTTPADIPGATVTLQKAGRYIIHGVFEMVMQSGDTSVYLVGALNVAGSDYGSTAVFISVSAAGIGVTAAQQWLYTSPAAGTVAKLRGSKSGGTGGSTIDPRTTISAVWIGP